MAMVPLRRRGRQNWRPDLLATTKTYVFTAHSASRQTL